MYDELVGDLRYCDKGDCNGCRRYTKDTRFCNVLLREAADAIEELQAGEKKFLRNISALEMENENLKRAGRWIPVTEKKPPLPEDEDVCFVDVIAAIRGRKESAQVKYCRAYRYRDGKRECIERFIDDWAVVYVTHWMPLPEPPKEERMNEVRINLNEVIKVKLTDLGKDIYYHQYDELNRRRGRIVCEPSFPKEDAEGYTKFQLWNFMELYGEHIGMAKPNVIEPLEIVYELPKEEKK